jgi:mannosyltransferase OCH1-like enzyme
MNMLQPIAYKVDLFRAIILYHYGGCYSDSKVVPLVAFDKLLPERGGYLIYDTHFSGIQIGIMGMTKGDNFMRLAIDRIVRNVESRYYGTSPLSVTGPRLYMDVFNKMNTSLRDEYKIDALLSASGHLVSSINFSTHHFFVYENSEYRRWQNVDSNCYYWHLWSTHAIYNEIRCKLSI